MKLPIYTTRHYANALLALLPPGAAWEWPVGGVGDSVMLALAQELARVGLAPDGVLTRAVDVHRPGSSSFHISQYRAVAAAAVAGVVETLPRKPLRVGSKVGDRLWSHAVPAFAVPLVQVDHLMQPLRVGSKVGDKAWSGRARYVLRVRYYRSVVDPATIWAALKAFKQAHMALFFEDITGMGGEVTYGQD